MLGKGPSWGEGSWAGWPSSLWRFCCCSGPGYVQKPQLPPVLGLTPGEREEVGGRVGATERPGSIAHSASFLPNAAAKSLLNKKADGVKVRSQFGLGGPEPVVLPLPLSLWL